jgi:putative transposase
MVRNGRAPVRSTQTGLGEVPVRRPRVDDRRIDAEGNRMRFVCQILPPYLRRTGAI